jgi:hypothetical protein
MAPERCPGGKENDEPESGHTGEPRAVLAKERASAVCEAETFVKVSTAFSLPGCNTRSYQH